MHGAGHQDAGGGGQKHLGSSGPGARHGGGVCGLAGLGPGLAGAPCSQPALTVCGTCLSADCTVARLGQCACVWGVLQEPGAGAAAEKGGWSPPLSSIGNGGLGASPGVRSCGPGVLSLREGAICRLKSSSWTCCLGSVTFANFTVTVRKMGPVVPSLSLGCCGQRVPEPRWPQIVAQGKDLINIGEDEDGDSQ